MGAMALLALPLIIPAASSCSSVGTHGPDPALQLSHDDSEKPLLLNNDEQSEIDSSMAQKSVEWQLDGCCCGMILEKGRVLVLGEEHSAKKLIRRVDFWLYYTAYFCGATVGLVYSNNLGQIAQSLNLQPRLTMLLAVYSSCSFFGRLLSALPDFLRGSVSLTLHTYTVIQISQLSSSAPLANNTTYAICVQEGVICSDRVAFSCVGAHASGFFLNVEIAR